MHCQIVMMRFSNLIAAKREKVRMMRLAQEEIVRVTIRAGCNAEDYTGVAGETPP